MQGGKFDAKALLGYCYYAGMIYTALKKFEKALYFYEVVCTSRETPWSILLNCIVINMGRM